MVSSIKENPRLRAAAEELHKAGVKVGDAVSEALRTMEESELMRAVRLLCSSYDLLDFNPSVADLPSVRGGLVHDREDHRTNPSNTSI